MPKTINEYLTVEEYLKWPKNARNHDLWLNNRCKEVEEIMQPKVDECLKKFFEQNFNNLQPNNNQNARGH